MAALVVYSDVLCPWSTVAVLRLRAARARAGADGELALEHRALPLELLLDRPIVRRVLAAAARCTQVDVARVTAALAQAAHDQLGSPCRVLAHGRR